MIRPTPRPSLQRKGFEQLEEVAKASRPIQPPRPRLPYFLVTLTLGLAVFLTAWPLGAQDAAPASADSVRMVVTVEPKHGNQIPTIAAGDMMVNQGHDRLPVTGWTPAKGDNAGLALAILIDDSAGFSLGTQLNDIRNFINGQPPSTLIAVGYMQNGTVNVASDFTRDHAAAAKSIRLAQGYFGAEGSPVPVAIHFH